ncbi:MAG: NIPSNAP family protein [Pirellulaceae bacterium]|nr:NIPSNAP family protein [Pirellulaceae bacterium]
MQYFEMRTYIAHDGMLEALHQRFRQHTNRIFSRHGITPVGYWTPADGPAAENKLVYLLAFPDQAACEAAWNSFRADEEWLKIREQSHVDAGGVIVKEVISEYLNPTDYSSLK